MGEFQRSRSKVWWSNYLEVDTEDEESHHRHLGWGGAGLVLSPSRGSSSSPSSSHKSQDSGFSDSEASSTPGCTAEQSKPSPLLNQNDERNDSPTHKSDDEVADNQYCECPEQEAKEGTDQSVVDNISNGHNDVEPKSPVKKLKGQFLSQCGCLGQISPKEQCDDVSNNNDGQVLNKSLESSNNCVDSSSQLPVKKLREKFLQDCICLSQSPTKQQDYRVNHSNVDTKNISEKAQKNSFEETQSQTENCKQLNLILKQGQLTENDDEDISEQQETVNSLPSASSLTPERHNRSTSSLSRSLPVPTIRTPQKSHNRTLKESPSHKSPTPSPRRIKNDKEIRSPVPSPRSIKNKNLNNSECKNDTQCSVNKLSPQKSSNNLNITQPSPKQNNENLNQSSHRRESPKNKSSASLPQCISASSNQSSKCEHNIQSPPTTGSERKDTQSVRTVCSELPDHLGTPPHTSTPKTTTSNSPSKLLTTPSRHLRCLGIGKKNGRPVNLLNNFVSTPNPQPENTNTEKGPVQQWLGELATLYEPECMTTLQSKSLAVDLSHQVAAMAATATDTVKMLQDSTRLISTEFAKLCQQLEYGKMEHVGPLVQSLVGHVTEFLKEHCTSQSNNNNNNNNNNNDNEPKVEGKKLVEVCDQLRLTAAKQPPDKEELTSEIANLGNKFTTIVDHLLIQHISVLVGVLEEPTSDLALRSAVSSLTTLGLEGPHLSKLIAQCGGVRALLAVCLESQSTTIRTAALRALATVCCVVEAIRQLEQAGGVEILSELLAELTRPEPEVSEAAAVLAQITAPWVEDNHSVQGLSEQLPSLVSSLTRLASSTASCETLLLAAAALANLTFMEPRTVWPLLENETAGKLLLAVKKRGPKVSVFLQEQAATLLANMAAVPESRPHLADQRAVVALLCFLQIRHSPLQRAPEIAAAERVQQKSAIALSRLCSDPVVAAQVVELQGVNRLVRLCKEERERNHSDGVLVACLAALRKIAANCGTKVIEDLDAMELVEPRLLDSFLIYSSRQESYV